MTPRQASWWLLALTAALLVLGAWWRWALFAGLGLLGLQMAATLVHVGFMLRRMRAARRQYDAWHRRVVNTLDQRHWPRRKRGPG